MKQIARTSLAASLGAILLAFGPANTAQANPAAEIAAAVAGGEVVDLTVTISENYPAHWPFHPPFRRWTMNWFCLLYTSPSPRDS